MPCGCCLEILFFLNFYLFIFRERGREERERNISVWLPLTCPPLGTWPENQACDLNGNQFGDPLLPRPMLSPLSHTSKGLKFLIILF